MWITECASACCLSAGTPARLTWRALPLVSGTWPTCRTGVSPCRRKICCSSTRIPGPRRSSGSRRDAEITLGIYRRVPVLWREQPEQNPWRISFMAMFHMANDSGLFRTRDVLEAEGWELQGNVFTKGADRMLPLYEAKMIHHFDHRYGTYEGQTQAQANMGTLPRLTPGQKADPTRVVIPRYWVAETEVSDKLKDRWDHGWLFAWRRSARSSDERTMIDCLLPRTAVGDSAFLFLAIAPPTKGAVLAACLSSVVVDYIVRQKVAGTNMSYFLVEQFPIIAPDAYDRVASWINHTTLASWISMRVMELSYTAYDMEAFARDLEDNGTPFVWNEERRFKIRAELDAAFFHLYGVARYDIDYIMDSFGAFRRNDPERFARTKSLILDIYDAMAVAMETGEPYQTILDPPPGQGPRHPADRRAARTGGLAQWLRSPGGAGVRCFAVSLPCSLTSPMA